MMVKKFGLMLALVAVGSFALLAQPAFDDLGKTEMPAPKASDVKVPTIEGVIVQADFNTDWESETDPAVAAQLKDTIEGSVSFMIDVPYKKIVANMLKPGTLGKVSPNIKSYTAEVSSETNDRVDYEVTEVLVPFKLPLVSLGESTVHLNMSINKAAMRAGRAVVDYELDTSKDNDWKRFSGSIYAVDLHNGHTMVMVATSTKSNYTILKGLRLKLAKYFLGKTKENIASWMQGLGE